MTQSAISAPSKLTIRALRPRPVNVSLQHPLQTSGGLVATAPLVLIDPETEGGVTGSSYLNQSLSVPEAIRRIHALDEQLFWIEEPTLATDYAGHAAISREARAAIQLGENWWGIPDMSKSLAADASDFVMADVMKIGGVTGWLRAASLAESAGLPLSSHLYPEFSAHLLAVTPTCHWLEFVDWANPLLASSSKSATAKPTHPPPREPA